MRVAVDVHQAPTRTAGEVAKRALMRAGIVASGETPTAAEIDDAITTMGDMLDSWSTEHLLIFGAKEMVIQLRRDPDTGAIVTFFGAGVFVIPVEGIPALTIGPSGAVHAVRPIAVRSAFIRHGDIDTPLTRAAPAYIEDVCDKKAPGDGYWYSYEGTMPDATIKLWPHPPDGDLHLMVHVPLTYIDGPFTALELPPGWLHALVLNLATHLLGEYGMPVTETLAFQAQQAKANIKRANLQPAMATFDPALTARRSNHTGFYYGD